MTYLNASHVSVRLFPVGEHLPERDAVAPYIAGMAERAVVVRLRRVPLDGPLATATSLVVRTIRRQGSR